MLEHHGQAAAGRVVDGDLAAHRFDEPASHGEAEADAVAIRLVSESLERVEEVAPLLGWDAWARDR